MLSCLWKITNGHLYLSIPRFNCIVERCSKSSCTLCTLRFLRSVRLALEPLMTINRGALIITPLQGTVLMNPDMTVPVQNLSLSVHLPVITLVLAGRNVVKPLLTFKIPVNGFFQSLLELQ